MATAGGHGAQRSSQTSTPSTNSGISLAGKQQVACRSACRCPAKVDVTTASFGPGTKWRLLVKLAVVGQVVLWVQGPAAAPLQTTAAQLYSLPLWRTGRPTNATTSSSLLAIENLQSSPSSAPRQQCFLQKQIAAGIAGQGKLRQAEQFGSGNSLCAHDGNDLLRYCRHSQQHAAQG